MCATCTLEPSSASILHLLPAGVSPALHLASRSPPRHAVGFRARGFCALRVHLQSWPVVDGPSRASTLPESPFWTTKPLQCRSCSVARISGPASMSRMLQLHQSNVYASLSITSHPSLPCTSPACSCRVRYKPVMVRRLAAGWRRAAAKAARRTSCSSCSAAS